MRSQSTPEEPELNCKRDSNKKNGRLSKITISPSAAEGNDDLIIFPYINGNRKETTHLESASKTEVIDAIDLTMLQDENKKPNWSLSKVANFVKTASAMGNNRGIRPATCIPIISIDHATEKDVHAKYNKEPAQNRYKDPKTGIPLLYMSKQMHQLSVPIRGFNSENDPLPGMLGVHPAFDKRLIKKPIGVKKIQYLVARRERRAKRREKRRRQETTQKVIDAERRRMEQTSR